MKRTNKLFDRIVETDNLRLAYRKALRGNRDSADARQFASRDVLRLAEMREQLLQGTFPLGRFYQFVIHDPKERTITAPCFSERVLHHAIMNVCEPVFERWLIHDTYACRVGRGRVAALHRAQHFARKNAFFLKMDIRKYFYSICHRILLARLDRLFKDEALMDLLARVVVCFQGDRGRGLPIGSLTSQHFANFYLGWFDRFVKETLRIKGYVRYMDDMLLWGDSARQLGEVLDASREYLADELDLEIKSHPYINRMSHGVDFLGCRVFADHLTLNRRSRLRFRRKMTRLETEYLEGDIDELELQQRGTSLCAFTMAGGVKSWRFRRSVLQRLPVSGHRPRTG
jgi:hypothetical protein